MTKQPTLGTIVVGYKNKSIMNKNFEAIVNAFQNVLFRDGSTPNAMRADYNVGDANVTNVNRLEVNSINVANNAFPGFGEQYVYKLGQLACSTNDIITHDDVGDPICLAVGSNGEVLKSDGTRPVWLEDTDTDTVGVTIQEDGVTVAENVTEIDFKWTDPGFPTIVTTPAGNQVDIALDDVYTSTISALWEDTTQDNTNIYTDGPSASTFASAGVVTRVDLINDVGLSAEPSSHNEYYVIMETSSHIQDSVTGDADGTWQSAVRFYDNTGTSTPLTGVQINEPPSELGLDDQLSTTRGGVLQTVYCGIPANARYIDFSRADAMLFPIFLTSAVVDNRYRAVVTAAAKEADFQSPNNISYPGGNNPSVTP